MSKLIELARDRPLFTRELHAANAWYGHAEALKRYSGWPRSRSLKVAIEHAPWVDDGIWEGDARTAMPIHLCAAPRRAEFFTRKTRIDAIPIGPFIRYVAPRDPRLPAEDRVVAFPAHSTHHIDARFELAPFLEHLHDLRDEAEVVVCIYWRDILRGLGTVFEEHGFRCVTAGHAYDQRFLLRLAEILGSASWVFTNEIGTHVLYAAALGRPVWVASQPVSYVPHRLFGQHLFRNDEHPRVRRIRTLFSQRSDSVSEEQQAYVAELLGASAFRSPEQLRALLDEAERRYKRNPPHRRLRVSAGRERRILKAVGETLKLRTSAAANEGASPAILSPTD